MPAFRRFDQCAGGGLDFQAVGAALADPGGFNHGLGATIQGEHGYAGIIHVRILTGEVTDVCGDDVAGAEEGADQVEGVGAHVHEGTASGKFRPGEPSKLGRIKPASVGGMVGVDHADAAGPAGFRTAEEVPHSTDFGAEGKEVAADERGVVLAGKAKDFIESVGGGEEGFFTHHGFTEGQHAAEEVEMPGVFRADDEAVHGGIGEGLVQRGNEGCMGHVGVVTAAFGHVIPDEGHLASVWGAEDILDEGTGVDVGGGEKGEAGGVHGGDQSWMRISRPRRADW